MGNANLPGWHGPESCRNGVLLAPVVHRHNTTEELVLLLAKFQRVQHPPLLGIREPWPEQIAEELRMKIILPSANWNYLWNGVE